MKIGQKLFICDEATKSALRAEQIRRKGEEPLRFVEFNDCVRRFADEWINPKIRTLVFRAPNAVGKTWGVVTCIGWTIWPKLSPKWFRDHLLYKWQTFPKSIRLVSTAEEVSMSGSIQEAIKVLWPKKLYEAEKVRKPFFSFFQTSTEFTMDIMTIEQAPSEFEGATRGLIVFNEPPPKPIYTASVARTRMGGMIAFSMTPLYEGAYIKDDIVDEAPNNPSIIEVTGTLEEACKDHSPRGHLRHVEIERLANSYDPDEVASRVHGEYMHLSGRIFKSFSRNLFVSKVPLRAQPLALKFQIIDPAGYNKPFAIIWGQIVMAPIHGIQILAEWPDGSLGKKFYFEHLKDPLMTTKDYTKMFTERERDLKFLKDDVHRILDKRFGKNKDVTSGESLGQNFGNLGYYYFPSYSISDRDSELKTGITAVKDYLLVDPISKLPKLIIDPSCVNTIRAMERWTINPKTNKPHDDVWKNFCDVIRYLCAAHLETFTRIDTNAWNENIGGPVW